MSLRGKASRKSMLAVLGRRTRIVLCPFQIDRIKLNMNHLYTPRVVQRVKDTHT